MIAVKKIYVPRCDCGRFGLFLIENKYLCDKCLFSKYNKKDLVFINGKNSEEIYPLKSQWVRNPVKTKSDAKKFNQDLKKQVREREKEDDLLRSINKLKIDLEIIKK